MKIKTKIRLFSSLFMLIIIVLVNSTIYFMFYKISTKNELDQLAFQTNAIVEAINANQDIPQNEIFRAFLPTNGMIRVINEREKELIPTITKQKEYINLPHIYSSREMRKIYTDHELGKMAVISKPMIWSDGKVVTLQVASQLVTLENTMTILLYVLIGASIFILVPVVIAGNILSRFILNPIKHLIKTMNDNMKREKWIKINIENQSQDELNEMEMTFNEMIDYLKVNFEKQEQFVSDASHELKTPISIIKGYAQLLERRGKSHPEVFDESVGAIDSETERMQQLVEQLLLLAKNKASMNMEQVDLIALAKQAIKSFKVAYNRDITLDLLVSELKVKGDVKQLQQVIYILISNALKYSNVAIRVVLNEEANHAKIKVIDHGVGISAEEQTRVFDRFYRVDRARSRDTGGTGLGLPIAKKIIEEHGGTIEVDSVVEVGTTFTVLLPVLEAVH